MRSLAAALLPPILVWLAGVNVLTAAVYARDKWAARAGGRRVRERTLWLLCLAGGAAGAWLAFLGLRHKTRHPSFWLVQTLTLFVWILLLGALVAAAAPWT